MTYGYGNQALFRDEKDYQSFFFFKCLLADLLINTVVEIALIFLAFKLKYNDYWKKKVRPKMISLFLKDPDLINGQFSAALEGKAFFLSAWEIYSKKYRY